MRRSSRLMVFFLALQAGLAAAQTAPPGPAQLPPAPTSAQQVRKDRQDADMSRAAQQVVQLLDRGDAGQVWDGASVVAHKAAGRALFIETVQAERDRLGSLLSRGQPSITRVQYPAGAQVPEGLYINVSLPTRFSNSAQPVRELVSFRLDEDQVWRVSGYSIRTAGN